MKAKSQPDKISGIIGKVFNSFGLTTSYNGWMVVDKWSKIVGNDIAQRSEAVKFEGNTLFVAVKDDTWRQEISMKIDEILDEIHTYSFGRSVKQIRLIKMRKEI